MLELRPRGPPPSRFRGECKYHKKPREEGHGLGSLKESLPYKPGAVALGTPRTTGLKSPKLTSYVIKRLMKKNLAEGIL